MSDPRLNSVHLPAPRRAIFRQARAALAAACGDKTLYGQMANEGSSASRTIIRQESAPKSVRLEFWLADGEFIYPLRPGLNTVGRSPENDVVIADAFVSRRQCAIVLHHHRGCELFDIASKNGTVLNGQKLAGRGKLSSGDRITLNERHFVFMSREAQPAGHEASGTVAV